MTRLLFALTLGLTATSAVAATWPWENPAPEKPSLYCKGLVVGGLASNQLSGTSRTDLWLAWNYVLETDIPGEVVASNEYQEGWAQLHNAPDPAAATAALQKANGDCGLGRSGHEITGW